MMNERTNKQSSARGVQKKRLTRERDDSATVKSGFSFRKAGRSTADVSIDRDIRSTRDHPSRVFADIAIRNCNQRFAKTDLSLSGTLRVARLGGVTREIIGATIAPPRWESLPMPCQVSIPYQADFQTI